MPLETKKKKKKLFDNITETVYISWGYGNNKLQKWQQDGQKTMEKQLYICVCVFICLIYG